MHTWRLGFPGLYPQRSVDLLRRQTAVRLNAPCDKLLGYKEFILRQCGRLSLANNTRRYFDIRHDSGVMLELLLVLPTCCTFEFEEYTLFWWLLDIFKVWFTVYDSRQFVLEDLWGKMKLK